MIDAVYEWRSSCRGGSSWAFRLCVLLAAHLRRPLHLRCFRDIETAAIAEYGCVNQKSKMTRISPPEPRSYSPTSIILPGTAKS